MDRLTNPANITAAIDNAIAGALEVRPRPALRVSQIGHECDRHLWYSFRWASMPPVSGHSMRVHEGIQADCSRVKEWLRLAGVDVKDTDASSNAPFTFADFGGHFTGTIDGVCVNVPEAPKTWHLLKVESLQNKEFNELAKHGLLESRPRDFHECHVLMGMADLDRTLYIALNRNDGRLYSERIALDIADASRLLQRAANVVNDQTPPPKLSTDVNDWRCRGCDFSRVCQGEKEEIDETTVAHIQPLAAVNCRTCLHATPETEGSDRWSCARWSCDIPEEGQREGCAEHRYIPALVWFAEQTDADPEANAVVYKLKDGRTFANGQAPDGYPSGELRIIPPELIGDRPLDELRKKLDAKVVEGERLQKEFVDSLGSEEFDEDVPL